jgi:hypothetical protein
MTQVNFIAPGRKWRNGQGGFRIKLTGDEANQLTDIACDTNALMILALDLAEAYKERLVARWATPITVSMIGLAISGVSPAIRKINEKCGHDGVVIEVGYPSLRPDVFYPMVFATSAGSVDGPRPFTDLAKAGFSNWYLAVYMAVIICVVLFGGLYFLK